MKSFISLSIAVFALLIGDVLGGCGGGDGVMQSNDPAKPYEGKTYSEKSVPFAGAKTANLSLTGKADGSITSTLTSATSLPKSAMRPAASFVYTFTGKFTGNSGQFSLTSQSPANSSISGTLPSPSTTSGGGFTIKLSGATYGPFPFGGTASEGTGKYDVSVIGLLPNATYSQPMDVNDNGVVVGSSDVGGGSHSFIWDKTSGLRDLNVSAQFSGALSINNSGTIVGKFTPLGGDLSHPHVYKSSGSGGVDIGLYQGNNAIQTLGVTESGAIVAEAYNLGGSGGITSTVLEDVNGAFSVIGPPNNPDMLGMSKQAGLVYGEVIPAQGPGATFWKSSGGTAVTVPQSFFANIFFIASVPGFHMGPSGEILSSRKDNGHAAIFSTSGGVTDLGVGGEVIGLNTVGQAVFNAAGAFIWTEAGGAKPLNSLIDPSAGVSLLRVWGINAKGQIICTAKSSTIQTSAPGVAVLLTPRP